MRRAAKVDRNQAEIVRALRQAGASVQPLHMVGQGCPDLLVGFQGRNMIFEIKDGIQPWSKQQLTDDERVWHGCWVGDVHIIRSVQEALQALK
jgi:hypothetical protein